MKPFILGDRLAAIYQLASAENYYFYDLCCDHGHLGLNVFLKQNPTHTILNDRVKSITGKLSSYIDTYIPCASQIEILNQDARKLKVPFDQKKFIVIAGIGGPLMINIISNLLASASLTSDDILLLSPHTKIYEFREFLQKSGFTLIKEDFVSENDKFYELLKVSLSATGKDISLVGDDIWQQRDMDKEKYLSSQIIYYSNVLHHRRCEFSKEILRKLKELKELIN